MFLSVILPTRKRLRWLQETLDSLYEVAANPEEIEVLLGMDSDDQETQSGIAPYLAKYPNVRILEFDPVGYQNLHVYVNGLAKEARGSYLLFWNDDARMQTKRWDEIIRLTVANQKIPLVYQLQSNHKADIFAAVPRQWYEVLGHISQAAPYDSWINDLADTLEVNTPISVYAIHFIGDERKAAEYIAIPSEAYQIGQQQLYSHAAIQQRRIDIAKLRYVLYPE
jgi:hypothetical protein